jgi:hypothetical protein
VADNLPVFHIGIVATRPKGTSTIHRLIAEIVLLTMLFSLTGHIVTVLDATPVG